jgi:hypothetical protein
MKESQLPCCCSCNFVHLLASWVGMGSSATSLAAIEKRWMEEHRHAHNNKGG